MKKKIIIGGIVLFVVFVLFQIRGMSMSNPWLDGERDAITRGTLVIPVSASGPVEASKLIEVKSKANGEVTKIHVVEGQMVKAGDILVDLNPVDERRNLERAQAELDRAKASLAQAEIRLEDQSHTLPLNTKTAKSRIDEMNAQLESAKVDWEKTDRLYKKVPPLASDQEWHLRKSGYEQLESRLDQTRFDYERAKVTEKTSLDNSREDVNLAKAGVDAASKAVEEAKERLKETKVYASQVGMVYSVRVREGELVQSGKTSLTGGTVLMYIADTSQMVVIAQVDEADIGSVRKIAPLYARPGRVHRMTVEEMKAEAPASSPVPGSQPSSSPAIPDLAGQRVRITVEAYRSESYEGIIERILPEPKKLNNVTTFDVRIALVDKDVQKLLGLQAEVEFTADRVENVLRVKNEAIVSEGRETYVYVPYRPPGAKRWDEKKVPVKIGMTDGTYTEIRGGLPKDVKEVWIKRPRKTDREREADEEKN